MKKLIFFLLLLSFFSIFSQTEFLKFYDLESVEYEKLEYYEGFLREEDIDDNDYETCRLLIYNDFSVAYYYSKKRGNENSIKIYNHAFVMGNELCQKFDTYKIQNEEKTYLILVGYTSTRFERFFYIFDITDKNNICFYKMVSDLFFLYQENEEFFGIFNNKLCFFAITYRWGKDFYKKNDNRPLYYIAPYIIDSNELKEFTEDNKKYRVYFDFDFKSGKGVYNINQYFEK